jgi:transcriptional regulator with XRE-family HTH domain
MTPIPHPTGDAGATNTPDLGPSATEVLQAVSGELRAVSDVVAGGLRETVRVRIRELRAARGWTQAELASRVGRNHTTISHWETGRRDGPSLADVDALALVLDVEPAALLCPGYRRLVEDDDTIERLARSISEQAIAAHDGPIDGLAWDEDTEESREQFRWVARAVVRALREET